jgi:hypothetical protein
LLSGVRKRATPAVARPLELMVGQFYFSKMSEAIMTTPMNKEKQNITETHPRKILDREVSAA